MSDPLAPHPLFSVPLYSTVLAGHEPHSAKLLAEIIALRSRSEGVVRSNRSAWHSGPEFFADRSESLTWILAKAQKFAQLAVKSELRMNACWANVLGPGGWNAPHHHHPSAWSGVYYVSVPGVGGDPKDPSGMIEFLSPTPLHTAGGRGGNVAYPPKEGLLLIFPASIYHYVHPHHGQADRVSIAFNFDRA